MRHATKGRSLGAAWSVTALLLASGGCEGEDVWVGQLQEGLNLDVCVGDGIQCEAAATDSLSAATIRSCDGELRPALEIDFTVDPTEGVCPSGSHPDVCDPDTVSFALSPDGSSWVLGVTRSRTAGVAEMLWVHHFDTEGVSLGVTDLASGVPFNGGEVQHTANITVDDRGHVFVVVYQIDAGPNADAPLAERAWLAELDPDGRPVRGPVYLNGIGVSQVAVAHDGNILVAANALQNARHGVLAALTPSGERLWSQTNVRTNGQGIGKGVSSLAADAAGNAFVVAEVDRSSNGEDVTFGLTRFDASGNAVWERTIDLDFLVAHVEALGNGDTVIGAKTLDEDLSVWQVRANGTVGWAYQMQGLGPWAPVLDEDGQHAYIMASAADTRQWFLAEIALDGESCERYAVPDELEGGLDAFDEDHRMYFLGQYALQRLRFTDE